MSSPRMRVPGMSNEMSVDLEEGNQNHDLGVRVSPSLHLKLRFANRLEQEYEARYWVTTARGGGLLFMLHSLQ